MADPQWRPGWPRNRQTPAYVQYEKPPLSFDGELIGVTDIGGFRPRFRFYDYGVISLSLSRPFSGPWSGLVTLGQDLIENDELETPGRRTVSCRRQTTGVGHDRCRDRSS